MRRSVVVAILLALLILAGLAFVVKNFESIRRYFPFQTNSALSDDQLKRQMKATAGTTADVSGHTGGGDELYGGVAIKGVLIEVLSEDAPIVTKEGKEIARSIVSNRIAYLDPNGNLRTIRLAQVVKLSDGVEYWVGATPYPQTEVGKVVERFRQKVGTMVFGNFRTDREKILNAMIAASREQKEIDYAKVVFAGISEYEQSWQKEIDAFLTSGDPGKMEYLFPLLYWSSSFDPSLGQFAVTGNSK